MVRLPYDVPLWQPLLSLALLYAMVFLLSALAGKIYRTSILMYGKRPSMREVWHWLTYKQYIHDDLLRILRSWRP